MHIPEGYLSPQTFIPSYVGFIPLLTYGFKKVKKQISSEAIPFIATLSALSFIVMMINIPIPGGTSGHAIGTAVLAVYFGPWVGFLAISMVLFIQAVFFGDGGFTSFAVNAFSMGFLASFTAYYSFHVLSKFSKISIASFFSGWLSILAASVSTAFFLGIQPALACDASGHPLYFPFGLGVTFPAIVLSHLIFFGPVEGFFTMLVLKNIRYSEIHRISESPLKWQLARKSFAFWAVLLFLVPLGLLSGAPAWGEWGISYFKKILGFVPFGIQNFSDMYLAPFADYTFQNFHEIFGYYLSAILGSILIGLCVFLFFKENDRFRKDKILLLLYLIGVLFISLTSNFFILAAALVLIFALGGKKCFVNLKYPLIALLFFNGTVTLAYVIYAGIHSSILIFNTRVFALTCLTLLMAKSINLFSALYFSKTLSLILTIAYNQIIVFKKVWRDFQLAFKSRTLKKPERKQLNFYMVRVIRFFIEKSLIYSREIHLSMKSRGFDLD